ncbi:hypothetical protein J132_02235 [Termitomyces sp. J132]|nr:hypothetical protein J132_02235 [Termitomyces sp. J132]
MDKSILDIISKIHSFIDTPSCCPTLWIWQCLAGHINWLLNVLPWGCPALTEMYQKIAGKTTMHAGIHLNHEVITDMEWLIETIPESIGVWFLDSTHWDNESADMVLWTDAALKLGLSFIYASNGWVYQLSPSNSSIKIDIFFLELIAILSAIHHVASFEHPPC